MGNKNDREYDRLTPDTIVIGSLHFELVGSSSQIIIRSKSQAIGINPILVQVFQFKAILIFFCHMIVQSNKINGKRFDPMINFNALAQTPKVF